MSVQTDAYKKIRDTNPTAMTGASVLGINGKAQSMFGDNRKVLGIGGKAESMFGGNYKAPIVKAKQSTDVSNGIGSNVSKAGVDPNGPLVQVNQYKPAHGVYDVAWNDATRQVMVAGQPIVYHHIDDDGNAWAYQSVLDAAYSKQGISDVNVLTQGYYDGYKKRMAALDNIKNQKFEFDANDLRNDVVWQAYENMHKREANRAYNDALSQVAARTGGNVSSMARAQAGQQRDYFLSQMTDAIPEIAQRAYERLLTDRNNQIDIIGRQDDMDLRKLDVGMTANDTQRSYIKDNQNAGRNRITDAIELDVLKSDADAKQKENTYQGAAMVNRPFTKDEAEYLGVAPRADGTYPTPNQILIDMQNEVWELYDKNVYDYEQAVEYINEMNILTQKYENDKNLAEYKNGLSKSLAAYKNSLKPAKKPKTKTGDDVEDTDGGFVLEE